MHSVAFEDNWVMWLSVHTESSQECFCSGAGASILQVKAEWTFAAERALCVHAPGAHGAGAAHTLIHVLAAGGSGPTLLAVAGELMAFIADTPPSIHARV